MTDDQEVIDRLDSLDKILRGTDKLESYYRILKIIKDEMQGEEEIKLKLMEAVTKQ